MKIDKEILVIILIIHTLWVAFIFYKFIIFILWN